MYFVPNYSDRNKYDSKNRDCLGKAYVLFDMELSYCVFSRKYLCFLFMRFLKGVVMYCNPQEAVLYQEDSVLRQAQQQCKSVSE